MLEFYYIVLMHYNLVNLLTYKEEEQRNNLSFKFKINSVSVPIISVIRRQGQKNCTEKNSVKKIVYRRFPA